MSVLAPAPARAAHGSDHPSLILERDSSEAVLQARRGEGQTPPSSPYRPSSHPVQLSLQPLEQGRQCLQGGPQDCGHAALPQPAARTSGDRPRSSLREPPFPTPSTLSLLSLPSHIGGTWEAVEKP